MTYEQLSEARDNFFALSDERDIAYDVYRVACENYDAALSGGSEDDYLVAGNALYAAHTSYRALFTKAQEAVAIYIALATKSQEVAAIYTASLNEWRELQ